jgi:type VI secretion system protein ImpA
VTSPPVLELDALVEPVPGANPAGGPVPDAVRLDLDEFRKEPDPLDPATAGRKPEWAKIVRIASDALAGKSKDLLVAVRLVEAVTKKEGVPGLRDGITLLKRLTAECWDRMLPVPADGEGMEVRVGPFNWINDVMRGAKYPHLVGELPLVKAGGQVLTYLEWLQPALRAEFEEAIPRADPKAVRTVYDDLVAARQALRDLAADLDVKMGAENAPDFLSPENPSNLGNAIEQCLGFVQEIAKRRGVPLSDEQAAAEGGAPTEEHAGGAAPAGGPVGVARDREGLYRQLHQIADSLRRLEPHSPIPFLIDRCVKLGALPFPELMRAMIRENAALDELDRLLGVEKHPEG